MATGMRKTVVARTETRTTAIGETSEQRPHAVERQRVGGDRPDRAALVQLDERPGDRRMHEADAGQRQRRHEGQHQENEHASALAVGVDPRKARGSQNDRLEKGDDDRDRQHHEADPQEEAWTLPVHPQRREKDLPPGAPACEAQRRRRSPGRPRKEQEDERDQRGKKADDERRVLERPLKRLRAAGDGVAEEVRRPGPERAAGRHRVALVAPAFGPDDGLRPLRLQIRARGTVEEGALELAPAALVVDPGIRLPGIVRVARDRDHGRP